MQISPSDDIVATIGIEPMTCGARCPAELPLFYIANIKKFIIRVIYRFTLYYINDIIFNLPIDMTSIHMRTLISHLSVGNLLSFIPMNICSAGGSRTHTGIKAHWILSPARLPVPPQHHSLL